MVSKYIIKNIDLSTGETTVYPTTYDSYQAADNAVSSLPSGIYEVIPVIDSRNIADARGPVPDMDLAEEERNKGLEEATTNQA